MSERGDNGAAAEPQNVTSYSVAEDGVALIRLERPQARNAINTQMLSELLEHLAVARGDDAVRVLVFSSSDHMGFSAGADVREGGGLAGHNGLKSLKRGFGSEKFWRVRVGVGRPDSTDPEIVSAWVLGKFREPAAEVEDLVDRSATETERLVERIASGDDDE